MYASLQVPAKKLPTCHIGVVFPPPPLSLDGWKTMAQSPMWMKFSVFFSFSLLQFKLPCFHLFCAACRHVKNRHGRSLTQSKQKSIKTRQRWSSSFFFPLLFLHCAIKQENGFCACWWGNESVIVACISLSTPLPMYLYSICCLIVEDFLMKTFYILWATRHSLPHATRTQPGAEWELRKNDGTELCRIERLPACVCVLRFFSPAFVNSIRIENGAELIMAERSIFAISFIFLSKTSEENEMAWYNFLSAAQKYHYYYYDYASFSNLPLKLRMW